MSGVGNLGGSRALWVDRLAPKTAIEPVVGSFASSCLVGLDPLDPEAIVERWELSAESLPSEKLLALRALLFRSLFPPLPPASVAPPGLSRSNPNCSKERLKEVVLVWRLS